MIKGKVLFLSQNNSIISNGYNLLSENSRYTIGDEKYNFPSCFSLTRRLFRAEITGLYSLANGYQIAVVKKGLFLQKKRKGDFKKCFTVPRGSKPLNICIAPSRNLYFGEYFQNMEKQAVNIYCSDDNAQTWHIAFTFEAGNINHIHGLFYDKYTNRIWVATGDRENECIIG